MARSRQDQEFTNEDLFATKANVAENYFGLVSLRSNTPGRLAGQMHTQGIRGSCGGLAVLDTTDFVTKFYELLTPG